MVMDNRKAGGMFVVSKMKSSTALLAFAACLLLAGCKSPPAGTKFLGQPMDIRFNAVDGRDVDVSQMRGKVVLVDFWASWCPPCVREIPVIKSAYETLHGRGFEVVGISLDDDKKELLSMLAKERIEWPQFYDPKGGEHRFAKQFGIEEIPVMWLLDKSGKLRDIDATENLREKVEKLLAE